MGSGSKLKFWKSDSIGLGVNISSFPFTVTVVVQVLFWGVSVGFGKGYDQ